MQGFLFRCFSQGLWIAFGVMVFGIVANPLSANAGLFQKKTSEKDAAAQQVQTYQPPPINGLALYCDPIRKKAAEISRKPALLRVLYIPRKNWLIAEHSKCKVRVMAQEGEYLKHVNIQQPPSLPVLKTEPSSAETKTAAPVQQDATP